MSREIIVLLKSLKRGFPFPELATIDSLLASRLTKSNSSSAFDVYQSKSSRSDIKSVELRANFKSSDGKQVLLVELEKPVSLSHAQIGKELGIPAIEMGFTTPHVTKPETYSTFKFPELEIRVTFNRSGEVTGWVLDTSEILQAAVAVAPKTST